MKTAVVVVDMQNDFVNPKGTLYVKESNKMVNEVNKFLDFSRKANFEIIWTKDTHPNNHMSFKDNGGIWPTHCVENTWGHDLYPELNYWENEKVILKGMNPKIDSYSAFFDNDKTSETQLNNYLNQKTITNIIIIGVAGDFCVKWTYEDSQRLNFNTIVLNDFVKYIN